jgi:uncharacterized protein YlxW (UPF0749 family)
MDAGPPVRVTPPPLLEGLMRDTLDPGYEAAARRRAWSGEPPPSARRSAAAIAVVGLIVVGLLLAVAFRNSQASSAGNEEVRAALAADIERAQEAQSVLETSLAALASEVRAAQSAAGGGGALASMTALEQSNALLAVTGPGLRITIDDPDAAQGSGAVLDKDVQLLVNGLWASQAEAIAISGVRLRVTSPIRQAGGAILVDNKPILWPMTIEAIGDPSRIHQNFISTAGYGRFNSFIQLYDVTFTVVAVDDLNLPAASAVDPHYLYLDTAGDTGTTGTSPTR